MAADRGDYLGTDAHMLMNGLLGQRPRTAHTADSGFGAVARPLATDYTVGTRLEFRRCGSPDLHSFTGSAMTRRYYSSFSGGGLSTK